MTVHVVGNVCVDSSFRLSRLPKPGETLNAAAFDEGVGGKGANQAIAAARAGASVTFWTALGGDAAAGRMMDTLTAELTEVRAALFDLPSDRSVILVDGAGENVIVTAAACAAAFDPVADGALTGAWKSGDILLMQGNLCVDLTDACLRQARSAGLFTILNPSPLPIARPELKSVSLLIANRPEAELLTGEGDAETAAECLLAMGADRVVITLGGAGALLHDGADCRHLPAVKADVVDTSGAGDCFAGTLAGALHRGVSLADAVRLATAAAGLSVGRNGTLAAFPTRAELSALATSLKLDIA